MYGKVPQCNETSTQQTNFPSPLALCQIEVSLYVVLFSWELRIKVANTLYSFKIEYVLHFQIILFK